MATALGNNIPQAIWLSEWQLIAHQEMGCILTLSLPFSCIFPLNEIVFITRGQVIKSVPEATSNVSFCSLPYITTNTEKGTFFIMF